MNQRTPTYNYLSRDLRGILPYPLPAYISDLYQASQLGNGQEVNACKGAIISFGEKAINFLALLFAPLVHQAEIHEPWLNYQLFLDHLEGFLCGANNNLYHKSRMVDICLRSRDKITTGLFEDTQGAIGTLDPFRGQRNERTHDGSHDESEAVRRQLQELDTFTGTLVELLHGLQLYLYAGEKTFYRICGQGSDHHKETHACEYFKTAGIKLAPGDLLLGRIDNSRGKGMLRAYILTPFITFENGSLNFFKKRLPEGNVEYRAYSRHDIDISPLRKGDDHPVWDILLGKISKYEAVYPYHLDEHFVRIFSTGLENCSTDSYTYTVHVRTEEIFRDIGDCIGNHSPVWHSLWTDLAFQFPAKCDHFAGGLLYAVGNYIREKCLGRFDFTEFYNTGFQEYWKRELDHVVMACDLVYYFSYRQDLITGILNRYYSSPFGIQYCLEPDHRTTPERIRKELEEVKLLLDDKNHRAGLFITKIKHDIIGLKKYLFAFYHNYEDRKEYAVDPSVQLILPENTDERYYRLTDLVKRIRRFLPLYVTYIDVREKSFSKKLSDILDALSVYTGEVSEGTRKPDPARLKEFYCRIDDFYNEYTVLPHGAKKR